MTERDPRTDPRPGDVLKRAYSIRTVLDVRSAVVRPGLRIETKTSASGVPTIWDGPKWRSWAKTAEIVKRGDEA